MRRSLLRTSLLALVGCLPLAAGHAQDPAVAPPTAETAPPPQDPQTPQNPPQLPGNGLDATTVEALERLATQLQELRAQRSEAAGRHDADAVARLDAEERELGWQFASLSSRIDVHRFEVPQQGDFDFQKEIEQLIRPLLQTLKDATEEPRLTSELQKRLDDLRSRLQLADAARKAVLRTRDQLPPGSTARAEAERELTTRWKPVVDTLQREMLVLDANIRHRREGEKTLFESVSGALRDFVQSSGVNLVLSVLVFAAVFLGLRYLLDRILQRRRPSRGFPVRMLEVALQIAALVAAIAATLVVPYARGDWLLLAVFLVFLLGAGWLLMHALPQLFEQVRLMLNVGGVREGERILVDGLPYRVDALRVYTRLQNPALQGGQLRVPLKLLVGMRSRAPAPDEPWFPCEVGDVVKLADGTLGPVRLQTPEVVVIDDLLAPRSLPTAAFLAQNPHNLSRGFVVQVRFGLDYAHQAAATSTLPAQLATALREGLGERLDRADVQHVLVELADAGNSALEFLAEVRFAGHAAPRSRPLERLVLQLLVAAATAHGLAIPFPQLTIHRADDHAG